MNRPPRSAGAPEEPSPSDPPLSSDQPANPEPETSSATHPGDAASNSRAHFRARGIPVAVFFFYFIAISVWSIATPIWGAPDEIAHVLRAYSVAHGQIYVRPVAASNGTGGFVNVPENLHQSANTARCFAFRPAKSAACVQDPGSNSTIVTVGSSAARYNPAYYVAVGLPSLVLGERHIVFAFRLVSAALSAWMLAWALTSASLARRPRAAMAAVLLAGTPMALFLGSVVNPNGLEITAGCSLWVNLLLFARGDNAQARGLLLRRAAISASVMVLMRSLSPVWLAVIVVLVLIAAAGPGLRGRIAQRDLSRWAAFVLAITVVSVIWIVLSKSLQVSQLRAPLEYTFRQRIHLARVRQLHNVDEEIGEFGWMDTLLPQWAYNLWGTSMVVGAGLVLLLARWRDKLALVVIAAVSFGLPILIEAYNWNQSGPVWQGRYSMPLTLGLILMGGLAVSDARWLPPLAEWFLSIAATLLAALSVGFALAISIHRYASGTHTPFSLNGPWQPPGGGLLLEIIECCVVTAGCTLVLVLGPKLRPASQQSTLVSPDSSH